MKVANHSCGFIDLGSKWPLGDNQQDGEDEALTQDSTHHANNNADQRDPGGETRLNVTAGNDSSSYLSCTLYKSSYPLFYLHTSFQNTPHNDWLYTFSLPHFLYLVEKIRSWRGSGGLGRLNKLLFLHCDECREGVPEPGNSLSSASSPASWDRHFISFASFSSSFTWKKKSNPCQNPIINLYRFQQKWF